VNGSGGAQKSALGWRIALVAALLALAAIPVVALYQSYTHRANRAPDFTLTDQKGQPFRLSAQRGHAVALFFGYGHCPDICPTTLAALARAKAALGARAGDVEIVFVTVDPERDTPQSLGRYVEIFDRNIVALTGTGAQLEPVYKAYFVYHQKQKPDGSANGYAVSHSAAIYMIDRSGRLRTTASWDDDYKALTRSLEDLLS
jgi:protein SCO1/2